MTTNIGFEQPRNTSKDPRARRAQALMTGTHSVLSELGVGTNSPDTALHLLKETAGAGLITERIQDSANAGAVEGKKSRGTLDNRSAVSDGDKMFALAGYGYVGDTNQYNVGGRIAIEVDGSVTDNTNVVKSRMEFLTGSGSSTSLTRALRIDGSQNVGIGNFASATAAGKLDVQGVIAISTEVSTPSQQAGIGKVYTKSDGKLYFISGDIGETELTADTDTTYSAGTLMDLSTTTFNVDLTEASEQAIANGDYILFLDGGATGTHAKENIADVATLFAGDGLTASAAVMAVNVDDSTIETSSDAIRIKDNGVTLAKMAGIARGKIIYGDASGDPAVLAVGDADQVLTTDGTDISWEDASGGGSGDITGVTIETDSGSGSKASDTEGSADFTLLGGSGVDVTNSSATITVAGEDATTSNKGVASFHSDNFSVSSGAVTIKDQGVLYAEIQNVSATDRILGRDSSGAGSIEEITPANLRTMINVADGAEVNESAFKTISVSGQDNVVADADADTLTFAAGTNVTITTTAASDTVTIAAADTNTMGSGFVLEDGDGTEVTVTENKEVKFIEGGGIDINWTDVSPGSDADPYDLTFTVADTTVDGDTGSTGITPGDTLTIAGGTNVTTAMSGDTLTITSTDTNTMGSGFVLEDGDGTEVTVTENKEVKFVEGGGIDIDWTDVSPGSDADPYDLTFTVSDTTVAGDSGSTGITPGDTLTIAGGTNVTTAMSGDTLTVNATDTNTMGSGFVLEDGGGTEVTVTENKEVKFIEGAGIGISWTDTSPGSDADPYDLTFTVANTTVAGDSGSTGITPGDTLTIAGGTNVTTSMSGDTLTVNATDTNTMGSGFVIEDGDGTEVTITENKEVKIVEGTGIDVNWTDVSPGSDADPYDLTISCDLEGTELKSTGETGGSKFLREDGDGTCSWQTVSGSGGMSNFFLEDGDGTEVEIGDAKEVKFVEGQGIDIDWTDVSTGSDADPYDLTFTCNLEGTELASTGESGGSKFLREDGDGTCSWQSISVTGMSSFFLEDGDGTEVEINNAKEVKFVEGGGIDINWTDTSTGSDGDPYDLTFTVADTTVDGDSGSTGITPGDTLTIAGGTNVTTAMSGDTLTITSTDTNTMGSGFVLEDGDGTEVTVTENQEVKFVEGGGIDINWTDTSPGSDADPYDLTFTVSDTTVAGDTGSTGITPGDTLTIAGGTNVTTAMSGDTLTITSTDTNTMGSGFVLEDGDGTEVTITENKEVKIVEGTGIDVNWTDTDNGTDGDPYDLTISCDLEGTELKSTGETGGSKFLREDGDGTCSWQTASGGSGDVEAGSTFTTAGVIMACNGDDKTIDEPGATLTTNGQAMTVSSAVQTSFAVDCGNRDGNGIWTFTTGTGDSGSAQNNQGMVKIIAQTSANASLFLGDTASDTKGGLKYKNNGDSMQLIANGNAVLELDSSKVVEFKIAAASKTGQGTADSDFMSQVEITPNRWLEVKIDGVQYFLPAFAASQFS